MIDPPHVTETRERTAAVIPLTIPRSEMQEAFGAAVDDLMEVLSRQDVSPGGPVFAHHLRTDPETFDLEVGVPVPEEVDPEGRVEPGTLPGGTVARTVYYGPYQGLPQAWATFDAWIERNGHAPARDLWETYIEGPHSTDDPSEWRTELVRPLTSVG